MWCRSSIPDLSSIGWFYLTHFFICFVSLIFFCPSDLTPFFHPFSCLSDLASFFQSLFFCPSIVALISWGSGCFLIGWLRSFDVCYVGSCCWNCQSGLTSLVDQHGQTYVYVMMRMMWWKDIFCGRKSSLLMVWTTRLTLSDRGWGHYGPQGWKLPRIKILK